MTIFLRTTDKLGVSWTHSPTTRYSRAEISLGSRRIRSTQDDSDQSVLFEDLQPATSYTIRICVNDRANSSEGETCKSRSETTLEPLQPDAVHSVSVNQSDPSATTRIVSFSYDNRPETAVSGFSVRLIKDNRVVTHADVRPPTSGPSRYGDRTYTHTFTNLIPFTYYEIWVVPFNQAGIGTSAGVAFTTPIQLQAAIIPLSGDSAMLRWWGAAPGQYAVEKRLSSGSWQRLGSYDVYSGGSNHRVVLDGAAAGQVVRVTWKLPYLRTESQPVAVTALAAGSPELIGITGQRAYVPEAQAFHTRFTVSFRTTVASAGQYVLQRADAAGSNWATVDSIGSLAPSPINTFAANQVYSMNHVASASGPYRVCRRYLTAQQSTGLNCSEISNYLTASQRRYRLN
jgi:hypothetical protein